MSLGDRNKTKMLLTSNLGIFIGIIGTSTSEAYESCPESSQPFWISREPIAWPWCNSAASQMRPYCASMNCHFPVGPVRRPWDAVDWACVYCMTDTFAATEWADQLICINAPAHSAAHVQAFFGKTLHHPGLSAPLQPSFGSLWLLVFVKAKITIESEKICEYDSHTVYKLSQRRLTAEWLTPQESDHSQMRSKVSTD